MSSRVHVAVVHRKYAQLILDGKKAAELRLSKNRIAPFGRVTKGDTVYFKVASGSVCAKAQVEHVEQLEGLTPENMEALRARLDPIVLGDDAYWSLKSSARFGTVIHLVRVEPCNEGPDYSRERAANPRAAWLVLEQAVTTSR